MDPDSLSGWNPRWMPGDAAIEVNRDGLRSIRGHAVVEAWVAVDVASDELFADLPVILRLDNDRQIEIAWQKFDDLSITWNSIDVTIDPRGWVTYPLVWRARAHPALRAFVGHPIASIDATRGDLVMGAEPGSVHRTRVTTGLWFNATAVGLPIFNALDENGLSNDGGPATRFPRVPL